MEIAIDKMMTHWIYKTYLSACQELKLPVLS